MTKPIQLIDGMLVLRRKLELDTSGHTLRNYFYELMADSATYTCIFCWEGYNSRKPRLDLYPIYKANRKPAGESIYEYVNLFRTEILPHTPTVQVAVPEREGDDVLAYFVRKFYKTRKIIVQTGDADLRQLEMYDGVDVLCSSLSHITPGEIRLYKSTVGDPSDNIKGIPGFGEKSFYAADRTKLTLWFLAGCDGPPPTDLAPKVQTWMAANRDECRALWSVTGFLDIDDGSIASNTTVGKTDYDAIERVLLQYCQ